MRTSFFFLIFLVLVFFVTSCDKDIDVTDSFDSSDQIELRTPSVNNCRNLIRNFDFEDHNCITGNLAFLNGCVPDWDCYWATADLVGPFWDWSEFSADPYWQNLTFNDNLAYMCCGGSSNRHIEGIYQDVTFDADKQYCLSYDVSSTVFGSSPDNGNLTVVSQIGSTLAPTCDNPELGSLPDCSTSDFCYSTSVPNSAVYPNEVNVTVPLDQGVNGDGLYFWVRTDLVQVGGTTGVFIDNVVLTCSNNLITGITADQLRDCTYNFAIQLAGDVTIDQIQWNFGDGSSSMSRQPTHTYASSGNYQVSVTTVDDEGCCNVLTTQVSCDQEAKNCAYYLCHTDFYHEFGCSCGVTVSNNGVIQDIPFTDCVSNNSYGIYDLINEFEIIAATLGVEFRTSYPEIKTCTKGDADLPIGYFFIDSGIQFLTLYGDDTSCPMPQSSSDTSTNDPMGWIHECED